MNIKQTALRQVRDQINNTAQQTRDVLTPYNGWIRTLRVALGMSGLQLGKRNGISKSAISNLEKSEVEGRVTLKLMKKMAESMHCQFVYAFVPEREIEQILRDRITKKAQSLMHEVDTHIALEEQLMDKALRKKELLRLVEEMIDNPDRSLWDD